MRRFILIFAFSFIFLSSSSIFAQEKTSDQYYQDLLVNYRYYQTLIEPFKTTRSRNQTYNTVTTKSELLESSKKLISSEIEAMMSYSLFIKTLLAEATKVINYHENYLYIRLDDEVTFLSVSKERNGNLTSLEQADALVKDLSDHYQKISQIGYQVKALIYLGSINKIYENLKIDKDKLDNLLTENSSNEAKLWQINAAREKFSDTNKIMDEADKLLTQASNTQKTEVHDNQKGISEQISNLVGQAVVKVDQIIVGYKNIVYSLK